MTINMWIAICVLVIVLIVGLIFVLKHLVSKQKEEAVADGILTVGVELIATSFGTFDDKVFAFLSHGEVENNLVQLGAGFVLLIIGILLMFHVKSKMYILNINGMFHDRKIENHHRDVGLNQFQFKEREIDFVRLYNKGVQEDIAKEILEEISHKLSVFKSESKDKKRGYTGVASIPFVMMAGKYSERESIDEYFEYHKINHTYYQLEKKPFGKRYPKLALKQPNQLTQITASTDEIVIAVSLTAPITDHQLSQFNCPLIHITVPTPKDNLITYKEQLREYVDVTNTYLNEASQMLRNLKIIHFVIAGQSCFAFEMGKLIDDNRVKKLINYHHNTQSTPNYPWGIQINGQDKGRFIS